MYNTYLLSKEQHPVLLIKLTFVFWLDKAIFLFDSAMTTPIDSGNDFLKIQLVHTSFELTEQFMQIFVKS